MSDALEGALHAVDTALFGYSALTPRLAEPQRPAGRQAYDQLRGLRDVLRAWLSSDGREVPAPAPAYDLPALADAAAAAALALSLEQGLAARFAALVQAAAGERRTAAADWLGAAAERAVPWRVALGQEPTTVPWPGLGPVSRVLPS